MLIDRHLPEFDVRERHHTLVDAPTDRAYEAVRRVDLARSRAIRSLVAARGLPARIRGRSRRRRSMSIDDLVSAGFVVLDEEPGTELVLGLVGQFWKPRGGVRRIRAEEFDEIRDPGWAKAAWNFRVEAISEGRSLVVTETRVRCTDDDSRRKFLLYWAAVGPFSGAARKLALKQIKAAAEGRGS